MLKAAQILAKDYYQVTVEETYNEHVPELQTSASSVLDKKNYKKKELQAHLKGIKIKGFSIWIHWILSTWQRIVQGVHALTLPKDDPRMFSLFPNKPNFLPFLSISTVCKQTLAHKHIQIY